VGAVWGHVAALRDLYPDTKIAMILPIWRADYALMNKPTGSFEEMRRVLREVAAHFNVTVIDGWGLVPHVTDVFADARLHPGEFGFQFCCRPYEIAEDLTVDFTVIVSEIVLLEVFILIQHILAGITYNIDVMIPLVRIISILLYKVR
jgi:hypothetical protein